MTASLESAIVERAARCGIELSPASGLALASHVLAVLRENPALHLTTIVEPGEIVERHLGEAFEGAATIDPDVSGILVDLGSGNGYPGIPIAVARPGLRAVLAEASPKKARFLRAVVEQTPFRNVTVVEGQIQRATDLGELAPVRVLTARALGSWEKILPRMAPALEEDGSLLLWAGESVESIRGRTAWKHRLALQSRRALPGRERSFVWHFRRQPRRP